MNKHEEIKACESRGHIIYNIYTVLSRLEQVVSRAANKAQSLWLPYLVEQRCTDQRWTLHDTITRGSSRFLGMFSLNRHNSWKHPMNVAENKQLHGLRSDRNLSIEDQHQNTVESENLKNWHKRPKRASVKFISIIVILSLCPPNNVTSAASVIPWCFGSSQCRFEN